ncbi:glycosyltransferase [Pseudanabaena galeata UHCC 0370]|uniref:4,4'-diaponeurosporenoate glycosyltransferase n=1 Tax=Pseudanabaena galeata UHCC 0370 TaxID=3110310 RepID=A0ABU5TDF0_9CYAN|nr:glycosyltransferase [Pseudanabaena galeata]MEA5476306.1 glycosyltransferase [Pseudanabaena galeata UHCC 0370]
MRLSIILPCLNEIRHGYLDRILDNLVNQLVPPNCEKEIIAVVSASNDGTELILENYAARSPEIQVVRSLANNRAQRLNEGIAVSTGDIILLHHPATLLPESIAIQLIEQSLSSGGDWGAFCHSFDFSHWLLHFTSWYSNHVRVKQKGIVYLDHCPFINRRVLAEIGNVPDLDIFEDTVLSDRLCQFSKPVMVQGKVITSARRFHQRGIYRHAMLNQLLKMCYHFNIDPSWLNRLYEQKASINVKYDEQVK